eukprot:scaffold76205_cov59-Phaeocystis_antarctica.AAC.5
MEGCGVPPRKRQAPVRDRGPAHCDRGMNNPKNTKLKRPRWTSTPRTRGRSITRTAHHKRARPKTEAKDRLTSAVLRPFQAALLPRLHGFCPAAAPVGETGFRGFHRRSTGQRCRPIEASGRLLELRCRARSRLPSIAKPAQHISPHEVSAHIVRRRPQNLCRQRLELLVVPPLRLGHLGARLLPQRVEDPCRDLCPALRAHRGALLGLEVPLRGLHVVPREGERSTEVVVRVGLVGPQGDGLAVGPGCFARVPLRAVPHALRHQLIVLVARLRGVPGLPLRELAVPLQRCPTILPRLALLPQLLVKRPVQLPSARVRRAVLATEVRRRQLLIAAHVTDGVLLSVVAHV